MGFFSRLFKNRRSDDTVDETRRSMLGAGPILVAAVAVPANAAPVSHPAVEGAPVPFAHIRHEGVHYRVSEAWHYTNTRRWPHLAAMSRDEVHAERARMLAKAQQLHDDGDEISDDEWEYVQALDQHRNVRTMVMHLGGRDFREFGFTGLDQVHTNDIGPLTCKCKVRHVFDHTSGPIGRKIYPHKAIRSCEVHAHLQHDHEAHYRQALADHGSVFG